MADNFESISGVIWGEMHADTPYLQPSPDTGPHTTDFYGSGQSEGINFDRLVNFIKQANRTTKPVFNWQDFIGPSVSETYQVRTGDGPQDRWRNINKTIEFSYIRDDGKKIQTVFGGKINKRRDYLEDDWGYILNIDPEGKLITATLRFYYVNTKQFRKDATETVEEKDYRIDEKYVAISITTVNLTDFCYVVKNIQGERHFKTIRDSIVKLFAKKITTTGSAGDLKYLYENLPEFAFETLNSLVDSDLLLKHLQVLKDYDDKGFFSAFVDSSGAVINLLRAIGDAPTIYFLMKDNPVLVKQLYQNMDGTSEFNGVQEKNTTIFTNLLWSLCAYMSYEEFKPPAVKFYIGSNYKLDSNVLAGNDKEEDKIFLLQLKGKKEKEIVYIPDDLPRYSERVEVATTKFYPEGKGEYYHPLQPVYLIDAESEDKTSYAVPAILVKAISDDAEWKDITKKIRIGADILAILLGIASLGTASPILAAIAIADISLSTADIAVAVLEDKLMQTEDGREFLEGWDKLMLAGAAITAGPLLGATLSRGARLLSRATVAGTKNFLKACIVRLVLEINIANFTKNTVKVLESGIEVYDETLHVIKILEATEMQKAGAIFVTGQLQAGKAVKKGVAVVYKGEVITSGEAKAVRKGLQGLWGLKAQKLMQALDKIHGALSFARQITPKLKTLPNEAFFWSGKTDNIGGEAIALEVAISKKGITLEGLLKRNNVEMPKWEDSPKVWEAVSREYAKQVSGEVKAVIGKKLRDGNVWENYELPALKENPNVNKIITIDPKTGREKIIFKR